MRGDRLQNCLQTIALCVWESHLWYTYQSLANRSICNTIARILPGTCDEEKGWSDSGLCHTEQESHGDKASIIAACRCKSYNSTPHKRVRCEVLCYRQSSDQESGRIFPKEVAKIKDA